jgi:hypothetical protein
MPGSPPTLRELETSATAALQRLQLLKDKFPRDSELQAWLSEADEVLQRYQRASKLPSPAALKPANEAAQQLTEKFRSIAAQPKRQAHLEKQNGDSNGNGDGNGDGNGNGGVVAIGDPACVAACSAQYDAQAAQCDPSIDPDLYEICLAICWVIFLGCLATCLNGSSGSFLTS